MEWGPPSGTKQEDAKEDDLEAARVLPSEQNHGSVPPDTTRPRKAAWLR